MFVQQTRRTLAGAAFASVGLIYHQTVYNLRRSERSPVIGLVMVFLRALLMVGFFWLMYWIMGVRSSPIRGDFMLYILSGIFLFLTHVQAVGAVSGSNASNSQMHKHAPLNAAVLIGGAALASLYQQVLAGGIILWLYHAAMAPVSIEDWQACLAMLILAWAWGCVVGLVFLAISPWWPHGAGIATMVYQRLNMVASGKMFVGNAIPGFLLPFLDWNPLFHIIDQTRGFAFINYNPRNSALSYPLACLVGLLLIGLMLEFVTRRNASASWSAGR